MGRPIKKSWFGDPNSVGSQLKITAKLPGTAVGTGFIVEQTGTRKYKVNIGGVVGDVFLVNKSVSGDLVDGEGFITVTPFGGSAEPVNKLTQYRVTTYKSDGSTGSYTWSANAASVDGQASIIVDTVIAGVQALATAAFGVVSGGGVSTVNITNGGSGYTTASVAFSGGGGTGAAATATLTGGVVTSITVTSTGSGYTSAPTVSISGDGTGATATSTVTPQVSGVTSITVGTAGSGYATAPVVTITGGGGTGATATATVSGGSVTGVTVTAAGSGYTSAPTVTIAAP